MKENSMEKKKTHKKKCFHIHHKGNGWDKIQKALSTFMLYILEYYKMYEQLFELWEYMNVVTGECRY